MYLKVKAKKIKNLSIKISQAKNNLVVNILNKKGYECDNSQISQIKVNRKLNSEQKKVILENQVEANHFYKLLKAMFILQTELPNYFTFTTDIDQRLEVIMCGKQML